MNQLNLNVFLKTYYENLQEVKNYGAELKSGKNMNSNEEVFIAYMLEVYSKLALSREMALILRALYPGNIDFKADFDSLDTELKGVRILIGATIKV